MHLSFRARLLLGFFLVLGLLAASALLASGQVRHLQQIRHQELAKTVPFVTGLQQAAVAAKAAANDERGFLLTGDVQFQEEFEQRLGKVTGGLNQARAAQPARAAQLDALATGVDTWASAVRAELGSYSDDPAAAKRQALGPNRQLRKKYESLLDAAIAAGNADLARGSSFDSTAAAVQRSLWLALLVATAVGVATAFRLARSSVRPLTRAVAVLQAAADGDLGQRLTVSSRDEFGRMASALDKTLEAMSRAMRAIEDATGALSDSSRELAATSHQLSDTVGTTSDQANEVSTTAEQVSGHVHGVATAVDQLAVSVQQVARDAIDVTQVAAAAVRAAGDASTTVTKLGASSAEIGGILGVISDIAKQTSLLALNSTIEAARAGTAGKGFAIVAGEVKELARQTADATEEISGRIDALQQDAGGAAVAVDRIREIIGRLDELQATTAAAMEEQSATVAEIRGNLAGAATGSANIASQAGAVAESTSSTALAAGATKRAADELSAMAAGLQRLTADYRLDVRNGDRG
ncbi:MAG TPA: methyl-accepting chemotaxis protein [Actinomycetes bacterium]